jgi:tetratricopeptide (TPR) repeat protein
MSKRRISALAFGFFLASSGPAWAAPPDKAGPTQASVDKASELMNQGVAQYSKGNLEGARQAFLEAFELAPHHTIASNLAEVEIKLGRYREASEHLNYVLRSLPPNAADERESAEKDLGQCRERVGVVRVAVSVQGAAVILDGKEIGTAPLETELWLDPGEYVVEARHTGYQPASARVVAKPGESHEVKLSLGALPASGLRDAPPERHDEVEADSGMQPKTLVLIGGGALTVAAATVGTIFLVKSGAASDDAEAALAQITKEAPGPAADNMACLLEPDERPKACATLTEAQNDEKVFKNVAIGGFIAAGALAVGTVATYLLWPDEKAKSARGVRTPGRRLTVAPWLDRDARGFTAEFSFP